MQVLVGGLPFVFLSKATWRSLKVGLRLSYSRVLTLSRTKAKMLPELATILHSWRPDIIHRFQILSMSSSIMEYHLLVFGCKKNILRKLSYSWIEKRKRVVGRSLPCSGLSSPCSSSSTKHIFMCILRNWAPLLHKDTQEILLKIVMIHKYFQDYGRLKTMKWSWFWRSGKPKGLTWDWIYITMVSKSLPL